MARKTAVRTTIEPGVVLKVDDSELTDLHRQGLIYSSDREGYGSHDFEPEEKAEAAPAAEPADKKKGA